MVRFIGRNGQESRELQNFGPMRKEKYKDYPNGI